MPKGKHFINVAPLTRLPLTRDPWFTYSADTSIPVGSIVKVPFFRQHISGVVLGTSTLRGTPTFRIKSIDSVARESFLTQEQCTLARFLSDEYFTPLGICFKHFLPTPTKKRAKDTSHPKTAHEPAPPTFTRTEQSLLRSLATPYTKDMRPFLLEGAHSSRHLDLALAAARKLASTTKQILILVPEVIATESARRAAERHFPAHDIVTLHSRLSAGTYFEHWERVRSGNARVIIGTRQALFAPFARLAAIVLTDEHNDTYKQWDMSPRYDGRRVARELAVLHDARLILCAALPSLTTWYGAHPHDAEDSTIVPITAPPQASTVSPFVVADLKLDRWKKNFSPISATLRDMLRDTLTRKKQAILFVNHQGMSHFSVCDHCKHVLRCPTCDQALVQSNEGTYYCLHCTYRTDVFFSCPVCRGTKFRNIGLGTERVEREVHKLFPYARVARIDRQTLTATGAADTIATRFLEHKIDILVGTQATLQSWHLPSLDLIGIIDTDSLFALPDFRSDERALQVLAQAASQVGHIPQTREQPGRVVLQTFHPENPAISAAQDGAWERFYRHLLEDREALRYPPFSRLVLLTGKNASVDILDKESQELYDKLSALGQEHDDFRPLPPHIPLRKNIRGRATRHILIRFPDAMPNTLDSFLKRLPKGWAVDVDPISTT